MDTIYMAYADLAQLALHAKLVSGTPEIFLGLHTHTELLPAGNRHHRAVLQATLIQHNVIGGGPSQPLGVIPFIKYCRIPIWSWLTTADEDPDVAYHEQQALLESAQTCVVEFLKLRGVRAQPGILVALPGHYPVTEGDLSVLQFSPEQHGFILESEEGLVR